MIQIMELAALNGVQTHLPATQTTVGFEVCVKHFAPTPLGKKVWAVAELTEINGRKLTFKVDAFDEDKLIGTGTHRRAVVQISD
jgi:predicted thioesterase